MSYDSFIEEYERNSMRYTCDTLFNNFENEINKRLEEVEEIEKIYSRIKNEYDDQVEFKQVLIKGRDFFQSSEYLSSSLSGVVIDENDMELRMSDSNFTFNYIIGVINRNERIEFERMIFRLTRGNCYIKFDELDNVGHENEMFIVFYRTNSIEKLLIKICDAFHARRRDVKYLNDPVEIEKTLYDIEMYFKDSQEIFNKSERDLMNLLHEISLSFRKSKWFVSREKLIYNVLNQCKPIGYRVLNVQGWILEEKEQLIREAVRRAHKDIDFHGLVEDLSSTGLKPPTYFETNYFTSIYQSITDTYGVPQYGEANPSLITLITFPFMFGMMFADWGHCIIYFYN